MFFLLFQNNWANGQVSNYVFSETTGAYKVITIPGETSCASGVTTCNIDGANGTMYGDANPDENGSDVWANLPFQFCLGGTTFAAGTRIYMDYNGWIRIGGIHWVGRKQKQQIRVGNSI
jgi:hypothetical protein